MYCLWDAFSVYVIVLIQTFGWTSKLTFSVENLRHPSFCNNRRTETCHRSVFNCWQPPVKDGAEADVVTYRTALYCTATFSLDMASVREAQRLITMSRKKLAVCRKQRGGARLRRVLLVATVLHAASSVTPSTTTTTTTTATTK